jgi:glycosyltransferase involved in cell wall biosynthesis
MKRSAGPLPVQHMISASQIGDKVVSDFSKRGRKINLLVAAAGLNIGGAEVVIKHLVQTIDRRRFNVTVCCIKACGLIGDELVREGIDIVTLSNSAKPKVDYFTFIKLLRLIRLKRIDVVHTHTTDALADAAVCRLLMPRLKLIHTFHFGNYPNLGWRHMWIEQVFSGLANRLIAVGEVQRRQIRDVFRFREGRIGRVWNGVSLSLNQDEGSFRSRVDAENCILVGTIATLIEQKGLFDLLAVARKFRDAGNRVRFVIVGDGHLRAELEAKKRELGLDDIVVFAGWVMNAAAVALPAFDVFFQPSLWEAMSIVILEAMAAGKPIVATRVGENFHIIEDEVDGLLVEPKDVNRMAAALGRLIDDPELRCRLGSAASKKVTQQFTVERMTRAYEEIYMETL